MNWKQIWMPHLKVTKPLDYEDEKKMNEIVIRMIVGYFMVVSSWAYSQISEAADGILSRGLDAGLSIGLLVAGLIVLGWYHYKYQQYSREVIARLSKGKDAIAEAKDQDNRDLTQDLHALSMQQIELSKDQIQTNKELNFSMRELRTSVQELKDAVKEYGRDG